LINEPVQLSCAYPALPAPVDVSLVTLPEHPCPYLPDRIAEDRAIWASAMPSGLYKQFMDAGFRRSGHLVYQPVCRGCRACLSIRVPVREFRPDKSQRRCERRNSDLLVTQQRPVFSEEKFALYEKYIRQWHGRADLEGESAFEAFLYDSPLQSTIEFEYREPSSSRLIAVGICDRCPEALSSVYFYFDPELRSRGLGTFGAVREIRFAAENGLPYYYLGYWVKGCGAMEYKRNFRSNEVLQSDGVWRRLSE
jgi:arginyl-tRNA--protein-N-Asp/Glu arginylyltransferase